MPWLGFTKNMTRKECNSESWFWKDGMREGNYVDL